MRKFKDIERDVIISIEELKEDFEKYVKQDNEYESFERYLSACMVYNDGTLEEV